MRFITKFGQVLEQHPFVMKKFEEFIMGLPSAAEIERDKLDEK
jgi:hypothetical protein